MAASREKTHKLIDFWFGGTPLTLVGGGFPLTTTKKGLGYGLQRTLGQLMEALQNGATSTRNASLVEDPDVGFGVLPRDTILRVDSFPILFNHRSVQKAAVSLGFRTVDFLERRIPGKNGEGSTRIIVYMVCTSDMGFEPVSNQTERKEAEVVL